MRWGIVGLGDVTERKSGPAFWKCRGSELVAVMRRTPRKAADWAGRVPGGKCAGYDNLQDFLAHPGLDAVYVSTRPGTHAEICRRVAAAGKAVYVEKPVGRCAAETREIAALADKVPVYTAYISRAYDRTQTVKRLLQEGVIGDRVTDVTYKLVGTGGARGLEGKEVPWRLDPAQSGGGLIMDVGCHLVDRIDYLCGPLKHVVGKAENRNSPNVNVEDYVHFTAEIGSSSGCAIPSEGAKVSCTWDFSGSDAEESDVFEIAGPKGSLRMAAMSPSLPVSVCDATGKVIRTLEFDTPEHTAQQMIQAVTDELRGIPVENYLSRGENAVRTSHVLDQALSNYYGSREIGFWEKPESWPGRR
jgi:predicted dehydrogenase